MAHDALNYERMIRNALRGVVRQALLEVNEHGLPGEHHFYIAFRTDHPGVEMPHRLRQQYPQEMTIVLQMQFWDLLVEPERFSVTLRFNAAPQRLTIPFDAIIGFADPAARLALEFDTASTAATTAAGAEAGPGPGPTPVAEPDAEPEPEPPRASNVVAFRPVRKK